MTCLSESTGTSALRSSAMAGAIGSGAEKGGTTGLSSKAGSGRGCRAVGHGDSCRREISVCSNTPCGPLTFADGAGVRRDFGNYA
jgi:hypothetical protein